LQKGDVVDETGDRSNWQVLYSTATNGPSNEGQNYDGLLGISGRNGGEIIGVIVRGCQKFFALEKQVNYCKQGGRGGLEREGTEKEERNGFEKWEDLNLGCSGEALKATVIREKV